MVTLYLHFYLQYSNYHPEILSPTLRKKTKQMMKDSFTCDYHKVSRYSQSFWYTPQIRNSHHYPIPLKTNFGKVPGLGAPTERSGAPKPCNTVIVLFCPQKTDNKILPKTYVTAGQSTRQVFDKIISTVSAPSVQNLSGPFPNPMLDCNQPNRPPNVSTNTA